MNTNNSHQILRSFIVKVSVLGYYPLLFYNDMEYISENKSIINRIYTILLYPIYNTYMIIINVIMLIIIIIINIKLLIINITIISNMIILVDC